MAIKKYKPTTPGRRGMTVTDYSVLSKVEPERSLLEPMKKASGRNNTGRITVRHHGGGNRSDGKDPALYRPGNHSFRTRTRANRTCQGQIPLHGDFPLRQTGSAPPRPASRNLLRPSSGCRNLRGCGRHFHAVDSCFNLFRQNIWRRNSVSCEKFLISD